MRRHVPCDRREHLILRCRTYSFSRFAILGKTRYPRSARSRAPKTSNAYQGYTRGPVQREREALCAGPRLFAARAAALKSRREPLRQPQIAEPIRAGVALSRNDDPVVTSPEGDPAPAG